MKRVVKVELEVEIEMEEIADEYQELCNLGVVKEDEKLVIKALENGYSILENAKITCKEYLDLTITPYDKFIQSIKSENINDITLIRRFIAECDLRCYLGTHNEELFLVGIEPDIREISLILESLNRANLESLFNKDIYHVPGNKGIVFTNSDLALTNKAGDTIFKVTYEQLNEDPNKFSSLFNSLIPIHPEKLYKLK